MRPELRRRLAGTGAGLAALAIAAVVGCGGTDPMRIGIVVDCMGVQRPLKAAEESGAQLPLLERGGRRHGDGLASATVAGRPVELVPACTEALEYSMLTRELRRLAEDEDVDAVVAAAVGLDEMVLRDVAQTHPGVSFVALAHGPREVTLQDPAPNLYRFEADYGQGVAGLAAYAYDTLGWRRVAIVDAAWVIGWAHRDAFAAEFCALGGRVTNEIGMPVLDPAGRDAARVPIAADGVAVFTARFAGPERFLRRLGARLREPAQRLVVGPGVIDDPQLVAAMRRPLHGVVGASHHDPQRVQAFMERHHHHFPGLPAAVARPHRRHGLIGTAGGAHRRPRRRRPVAGRAAAGRCPPGQPARRLQLIAERQPRARRLRDLSRIPAPRLEARRVRPTAISKLLVAGVEVPQEEASRG